MQAKTDLLVIPNQEKPTASGQNDKGFAYYETIGQRKTQEDALTWLDDLDAESNLKILTPLQAAQRLWSAHKQLDAEAMPEKVLRSGTTATSNYYDGRGNIITATLADACSFAVVFGKDRSVLKVIRLNSITHKPSNLGEMARIHDLGGKVSHIYGAYRVSDLLAVSRAIGDNGPEYRGETGAFLVSADSHLDLYTLDELTLNLSKEVIGSVEIISTCDGFTDGSGLQRQEIGHHELYLLDCLNSNEIRGKAGQELCRALVDKALEDKSCDNITVAVQVIYKDDAPVSTPLFWGVYDGHGGVEASVFVASTIGTVFRSLCALTEEEYKAHACSVYQHPKVFSRDNPKFFIESNQPRGSNHFFLASSSETSDSDDDTQPAKKPRK